MNWPCLCNCSTQTVCESECWSVKCSLVELCNRRRNLQLVAFNDNALSPTDRCIKGTGVTAWFKRNTLGECRLQDSSAFQEMCCFLALSVMTRLIPLSCLNIKHGPSAITHLSTKTESRWEQFAWLSLKVWCLVLYCDVARQPANTPGSQRSQLVVNKYD